MREDEVRKVLLKYLRDKGEMRVHEKHIGPDVMLGEGRVVEVKGSRFVGKRLERFFRQLVEYTLDYPEVAVALSVDALDSRKIFALYAAEEALKYSRVGTERLVKIYLVAKKDDKEYYVREFCSVKDLFEEVERKFTNKARVSFTDTREEALGKILLAYKIDEEIRGILTEETLGTLGKRVLMD